MTTRANKGAAANGLSAVRSGVAGNRERTVRSTAAAEAVAELGRSATAKGYQHEYNNHKRLATDDATEPNP